MVSITGYPVIPVIMVRITVVYATVWERVLYPIIGVIFEYGGK